MISVHRMIYVKWILLPKYMHTCPDADRSSIIGILEENTYRKKSSVILTQILRSKYGRTFALAHFEELQWVGIENMEKPPLTSDIM